MNLFYSSIMNITAVITSLIFGKLSDFGVEYAMAAGAVFCFSGMILYTIWQSQNKSDQKIADKDNKEF